MFGIWKGFIAKIDRANETGQINETGQTNETNRTNETGQTNEINLKKERNSKKKITSKEILQQNTAKNNNIQFETFPPFVSKMSSSKTPSDNKTILKDLNNWKV